MLNKIKVIVPFYNPGVYLEPCIVSLLIQNYDNFEVLFIDDASTDGSLEKIPACTFEVDANNEPVRDESGSLIIKDKHPLLEDTKCLNISLWKASSRATALPNLHNAVMNFCTDPDDIVVLLDGDDGLIGREVLSFVNDQFVKNPDLWMMYGGALWSNGNKGCSTTYSEREFKNVKSAPFRISHLRCFRAGLYHAIKKTDPEFKCMRDSNGEFFKSSYDTAMFYPMLQMCNYKNVKHNIEKNLYMYNLHQNNDHVVNQQLQWDVHEEVIKKPNFKKIESYK